MNKHIVYVYSLLFIFNCSNAGGQVAKPAEEGKPTPAAPDEGGQTTLQVLSTKKGQPAEEGPTNTRPKFKLRVINEIAPIIEVNLDGSTHVAVANESSSNAAAQSSSKLRARLSANLEQRIEQVINLPFREFAHSLQSSIIQHKRKAIAGTVGGAYLTISTFLIFGNQFVNRTDTWASWKKQLSTDEMLQLSQDDLGKDLIRDIQQRHVNVQNPTDHITPLVRFIQAVEYEERLLNRYVTLASTLRLCRLTKIVPTNETKMERAREARRRLMFVKHIFISWTATDNLKNFHH